MMINVRLPGVGAFFSLIRTKPSVRAEATVAHGFLSTLRSIVGHRHVLTRPGETRRFRTGYRFGTGEVLAVVRPGNLVQQWRVLQACVGAGKIVIMQAANTGLTGGSTPDGDDYDGDVVLVNTMRITGIRPIDGGRQVVCLPGATLHNSRRSSNRSAGSHIRSSVHHVSALR